MNPYDYINSLRKFGDKGGFKPGLERVRAMLAQLGNPEKKFRSIHVSGTNGKGSTIAFLQSIYREAGYKAGIYTSPHLLHFNQRMLINGIPITTIELKRLIEDIIPVVKRVEENDDFGSPTFFEIITVIAFLFFARNEVELAILETGLGGRLDATNVVEKPLAALITSIGLEHTEFLGNTTAQIAYEKAGIIKEGRPVFTAVRDFDALEVIEKISREKNACFISIDKKYSFELINASINNQKFKFADDNTERIYKINLLGKHQIRNAVLALVVVWSLLDDYPVSQDDMYNGLEKTSWPGRLEKVHNNPAVLIDGAHNHEGMERLVDYLSTVINPGQKIVFLLSILDDKDVFAMLESLQKLPAEIKVHITKNREKRALPPEDIKKVADELKIKNKIYPELKQALLETMKELSEDSLLIITGSLYTVAESRIIIKSFFPSGIN